MPQNDTPQQIKEKHDSGLHFFIIDCIDLKLKIPGRPRTRKYGNIMRAARIQHKCRSVASEVFTILSYANKYSSNLHYKITNNVKGIHREI